MDYQAARDLVAARLARWEVEMNDFGSALPGFENRKIHHLVVVDALTQEHDFGWVTIRSRRTATPPLNSSVRSHSEQRRVYGSRESLRW